MPTQYHFSWFYKFLQIDSPFKGNRHNEKYGDRHCDVLPRVEEVWKQYNVDVGGHVEARPKMYKRRMGLKTHFVRAKFWISSCVLTNNAHALHGHWIKGIVYLSYFLALDSFSILYKCTRLFTPLGSFRCYAAVAKDSFFWLLCANDVIFVRGYSCWRICKYPIFLPPFS